MKTGQASGTHESRPRSDARAFNALFCASNDEACAAKALSKVARDDLEAGLFFFRLLLRRLLFQLFYCAKVGTAERRLSGATLFAARCRKLPLGFRGLERVRDGYFFIEPVAFG